VSDGTLYAAHVELYDRAFSWDITEEVDWLLGRLGVGCRRVLEPGCGTGRYLEALKRRGIEALGFDRSPAMVEWACRRGEAVIAEMADFHFDRRFDGAICPIGTLALLTPEDAERHLVCMGRHLARGSRYLVQVAIRDPLRPESALHTSTWERNGVRVTWATEDVDLERGVERQRSRIEILTGPGAGELVEDVHVVTAWTPASWERLIDRSPFELAKTFDGGRERRPEVPPGSPGRLLWHELARS
jgi:SAM-dependent methyltransferase